MRKIKKKIKIKGTPIFVAVLFFTILVTGCVPPTVSGQSDVTLQKNINYILAVNEGLRKKVAELEENTERMARDVDNIKKGLSSLTVETKSAIAESNAELDRFLEEFSFVRGGAEETQHIRSAFREDIALIKQQQTLIARRIEDIRNSSIKTNESETKTDLEIKKAIIDISKNFNAMTGEFNDLTERVDALNRDNDSLRSHITDLETLVLKLKTTSAPVATIPKIKTSTTPAYEPPTDPRDLYMEGYRQVMGQEYSKGTKTLKRFIKLFPSHELTDNAQYWIAETYYARNEWERAVLEFNKVTKLYPEGDKVSGAMLKLGYSFLNIGAKKEARVILKRIVDKYPESFEAEQAKARLKEIKE